MWDTRKFNVQRRRKLDVSWAQERFGLPPAVAGQLDLSRLQLVKDSFIDETLQEHFSELGVGLLLLKHIFRGDLHTQLHKIMKLWYTLRQQEHALCYLEAVIRYVASAGRNVSAEDVRAGGNRVRRTGRRCSDRHNCTAMAAARRATR